MTYLRNLWLWLTGFGRFDEVDFRDGWDAGQLRWWLLYLLDYGANAVLLAGTA